MLAISIVGAVWLLLLIPVRLHLRYDGRFFADLRWLFLRFKLAGYEKKPKEKKQVQPPSPPPDEASEKKKFNLSEFKEKVEWVLSLVQAAIPAVQWIVRHTKISRLELRLRIGGEDAAQTAITYGKTNAFLYGALAVARNYLKVGKTYITLSPDYTSEQTKGEGKAVIRLCPLFALIGGVWAAASVFKRILQMQAKGHPVPSTKEQQGKDNREKQKVVQSA